MRRTLIGLVFSLSAVGCMVGPDYQRPRVDAPAAFRYEIPNAVDTADTAWWRQFRDPVLDGLIAEALAANKDVKIAAANIEQAAGVLTQTRAPLFPQAGYGATAARERLSKREASPLPSGIPNPQTNYQVFAGASWEIDLWGRIRRLTESAQANLLASEEARRGVVLTLVASVAGNYLQLRGLDEQLAISQRTLNAYAQSLNLFELQYKYGQVSLITVAQARSQYETAAAQIPQVERQIGLTENAIAVLLGRNPSPIPRGRTIYELALPAVPNAIPSQVLAQRPDILQAEQDLVAANAQIGAARALYFPAISLTGSFGASSEDLHNLFKGGSRVWNYGGSVTGPIFTAGAISGQVEQAEALQKAALLTYELAIQNAFRDVDDALMSREKLSDQLAAQERLVAASREYERLAMLLYNGGYVPYSTVLQAQQQLFPAELNLAQTRSFVFESLVAIYRAMGGGWVDKAEGMTAASP
jgi:outer membrane protein, multidrug efflux system